MPPTGNSRPEAEGSGGGVPAREGAATGVSGHRLRRTVLAVALLNLGYIAVELVVALAIGSVSLLADSVDFFEDAAINLLIWLALGWSLRARATAGRVMAGIVLLPALAAAWEAFAKARAPQAPDVLALVVTAGGAAVVNGVCAWMLARVRHDGGALGTAAWLAARNDVLINLAIMAMGAVTAWTRSGWPDVVLGVLIVVVNVSAAKEVWEVAGEERLAARAMAGEEID